ACWGGPRNCRNAVGRSSAQENCCPQPFTGVTSALGVEAVVAEGVYLGKTGFDCPQSAGDNRGHAVHASPTRLPPGGHPCVRSGQPVVFTVPAGRYSYSRWRAAWFPDSSPPWLSVPGAVPIPWRWGSSTATAAKTLPWPTLALSATM